MKLTKTKLNKIWRINVKINALKAQIEEIKASIQPEEWNWATEQEFKNFKVFNRKESFRKKVNFDKVRENLNIEESRWKNALMNSEEYTTIASKIIIRNKGEK